MGHGGYAVGKIDFVNERCNDVNEGNDKKWGNYREIYMYWKVINYILH